MSSREETLLIHLGGLGDLCLSESAFLSVRRHFGKTIRALGHKRLLDLFDDCFVGVESIDARAWAYLFSDSPSTGPPLWQRIIFFGKDRTGSFRERLGQLTRQLIFVDMYPDQGGYHVEEYQLEQLARLGLEPVRKSPIARTGNRVILYPERPFRKRKWSVDCFVEVYWGLKERGVDALLMRDPELALPVSDTFSFESLRDVEAFFSSGGIFFSNDSGMAHFAARCGLRTLTLFWDADPVVWRPTNGLVFPCRDTGPVVEEALDFIVSGMGRFGKGFDPEGRLAEITAPR